MTGLLPSSWRSLNTLPNELCLNRTLNSGQTFRWKKIGVEEWCSVLRGKLVAVKQTEKDVLFRTYGCESIEMEECLRDYFQLKVNLSDLYKQWNQNEIFSTKTKGFDGVRVLRQDPEENLLSFLCTQNNNIKRITGMIDRLCERYGKFVAEVQDVGLKFHEFPEPSSLIHDDAEQQLRDLGFGYRAKYIYGTAKTLVENGEPWLKSLRSVDYETARAELLKLPGVGPKVADCVCLFSLDKMQSVPVDTHVRQIALRDFKMAPPSKSKTLTPKDYAKISEFFLTIFGPCCGWAHSVRLNLTRFVRS
ncbi:DNA glycosylase [Cladochytrium replicatum]|nr:DNA glycosylase [Cladochytrium replicatum]